MTAGRHPLLLCRRRNILNSFCLNDYTMARVSAIVAAFAILGQSAVAFAPAAWAGNNNRHLSRQTKDVIDALQSSLFGEDIYDPYEVARQRGLEAAQRRAQEEAEKLRIQAEQASRLQQIQETARN